ncbi:hypothetical protein BDQ17DRAFT_1440959 [Cyathus striatus]|nr:hypothetical protein BDQ17DRAFT_1440959 [Cyathus striatus]
MEADAAASAILFWNISSATNASFPLLHHHPYLDTPLPLPWFSKTTPRRYALGPSGHPPTLYSPPQQLTTTTNEMSDPEKKEPGPEAAAPEASTAPAARKREYTRILAMMR